MNITKYVLLMSMSFTKIYSWCRYHEYFRAGVDFLNIVELVSRFHNPTTVNSRHLPVLRAGKCNKEHLPANMLFACARGSHTPYHPSEEMEEASDKAKGASER